MRKAILAGLGALVAVAAAVPAAQAQTRSTLTDDIRCLLILVAAKPPPEQQAAFQMSQVYLIGRIDALAGDTDWVPRVAAEAQTMARSDITADQKACSAFLVTKGEELVQRGQRLQSLGQELDKPKP